ncbi:MULTISPECIES: phage baseplate assembly protein [unclassified Herbaspirillum]|nr:MULTISPECIES: baseplate protein [unclassified Herbaspirillum]RFB74326.1 baseplate protein [Herbaspirillum sp. 3R-3a1]TFI11460.1 baseplate protein [Herbaspirillum sp. 3R11]TFI16275.1 baseplate protein [Herbaspirillum sp. 3R-11]TFI28372.1 baseplate protein [Herbaspirillum sp. 3C11]
MSNDDDVTLTVNGYDYGGWTEVDINAGVERQARDFSLGITWEWPGSGATAVRIRKNDRCEVRIGNDLVLTGYVFATPIEWDKKQIQLTVKGRSLTADLVDACPDDKPGQWRNQSIEKIVRALVAPYGIQVVNEGRDATVVKDHTVKPGETVFESIDRLLTVSRLFSTDDGRGRLVMARPGSKGWAANALELGVNLLTGNAPLDFSSVFSEYVCKGQKSSSDDDEDNEASAEVSASAKDERMDRHRRLVIHESGQVSKELAQWRADWEREHRISKALEATYSVQGWRQSNGQLWLPNLMARLIDPIAGFDRDMLIAEAGYHRSRQRGTLTTMKVAPPDGFEPEPNDKRKRQKLKKSKDGFEYLLPADWEKN